MIWALPKLSMAAIDAGFTRQRSAQPVVERAVKPGSYMNMGRISIVSVSDLIFLAPSREVRR